MLRTDRTARLTAECDEAFHLLWEWVKREGCWNCVVFCHPGREIQVHEPVNPIEHDKEGRGLIMRNARARRTLRDYLRQQRATTTARGECQASSIPVNRDGVLQSSRRTAQ